MKKEYILCAAIWYKELPLIKPNVLKPRGFAPSNMSKGVVLCGWRHSNCLYQMIAITGLTDYLAGESIEGFLTNKNRFVVREEAAKIAFEADQTDELLITLYSEDLY